MDSTRRQLLAAAIAGTALAPGSVRLVLAAERSDPAASAGAPDIWPKIVRSVFDNRAIADANPAELTLQAPLRAADGAFVPITVRTAGQPVKRLTLVVDANPGPVAAVVDFGPRAARADLETRLRVDAYSMVRAIAELPDGRLVMATRFVKASGGCSAPAGADAQLALANLGRMQLRVDAPRLGQPAQAQVNISHPNHSGLALDQVSRLYTPAHFVRRLDVFYGAEPVLRAELDFALSENPSLRFQFVPTQADTLRAEVEDTEGKRFQATLAVQPAAN